MTDIVQLAEQHAGLPEEIQIKAGQALTGDMAAGHEQFMIQLIKMVDDGVLNLLNPTSFLQKAYQSLDEVQRGKVDLQLINLMDQTRHIYDFYKSVKTPNASPQLQTMVEQLWQMKSKLEEEVGDVLKI